MRLKVAYWHQYGTEKLMRVNMLQILAMHEALCTKLITH
jgi:hypothetical protein